MKEQPKNLIAAVNRLAEDVGVPLSKIADALGGLGPQVPVAAVSDSGREELIVRYTVGYGEFGQWKGIPLSALHMNMFKLDGTPDGTHEGVWQPLLAPPDLFTVPPPPQGPLDAPKGPMPTTDPRAQTKAIWTFGDGSSLTAVGPAELLLVPYTDGSGIFLVAVSAIITNGEGVYAGARGTKTASGSTFVPKGVDIFNAKPGDKFGAVTVEVFRVIRAGHIGAGP